MGTVLCIYENVASVLHARKDQQQRLRDPAVNVIAQDMSAQGYDWQCRQLSLLEIKRCPLSPIACRNIEVSYIANPQ